MQYVKKIVARCFMVVLFQGIVFFALSQKQDLKFTHLSTEKGLSQSVVQCILKDSKGLMWFGTRDGLNRYDGNTFTIYKYDPEKKESISNNFINDILEDTQGNLWIATKSGLNKFDRKKNTFSHFNLGRNRCSYD
jgi:ligand-binding sensor domain-containing protein